VSGDDFGLYRKTSNLERIDSKLKTVLIVMLKPSFKRNSLAEWIKRDERERKGLI